MIGEKTIQTLEVSLTRDFKKELRDQGHYLTGELENSLRTSKIGSANSTGFEVEANDYVNPVNTGVPAANIPFDSSQRTGAKTSKYIQGLTRYAELRFGASGKEALSVAFAIAKKHEKEGMPTKSSYGYSDNGRRTRSIEETYNQNEKEYDQLIENGLSQELDQFIDKTFDQTIF